VKAGLWVLTGGLILIWTAGMALLGHLMLSRRARKALS
jgi:hypothetical protein